MSDHPSSRVEEALVGVVLEDPGCWPVVTDMVRSSDLADRRARMVFATMEGLVRDDQPLDLLGVGERLREGGDLQRVGGETFLQECLDRAARVTDSVHVAGKVKGASRRRAVQNVLEQALDRLRDEEAEEVVPRVISDLAGLHGSEKRLFTLSEALDLYVRRAREGKQARMRVGIQTLDEITGGFRRGELVVVAGRPYTGKSIFVTQVVAEFGARGIPGQFFSLEMGPEELAEVAFAQRSGESVVSLRENVLLPAMKEAAQEVLGGLPVTIANTPGITLDRLCQQMRTACMRHGARVFVVDNLSLMRNPTSEKAGRVREVATITAKLKTVARELDVLVFLVAHLNRQIEARQSQTPRLSDLRDSGAIEQDADAVLMLERLPNSNASGGVNPAAPSGVIVHVPKRRGGPPGMASLFFDPRCLRFRSSPDALRSR